MSIKTITRIKFIVMIIVPAIAVLMLAQLEWRLILLPEIASPVYLVLFFVLAISIFRYMRRCKACGVWNSVREISREEINRMEHPQERKAQRKVFQVRFNVMKRCKHCEQERLYEIIKEIKVK